MVAVAKYFDDMLNKNLLHRDEWSKTNHEDSLFISSRDYEFSTMSLCTSHPDDISNDSICPHFDADTECPSMLHKVWLKNYNFHPCKDSLDPSPNNQGNLKNINLPSIPRGKYIAYNHIQEQSSVHSSFDIETRGDKCGIFQLSAQLFSTGNKGEMNTGPKDIFDSYVKPPEGTVIDAKSMVLY